jgi:hypothetical protein
MPLLYERVESEGDVEIRLSTAWYIVRYGLLALAAVAVIAVEAIEGSAVMPVVGAILVGVVAVRLFGFWPARREILDAMKRDSLSVSGSAWDPRRPLRYRFRRQPPPARSQAATRGV